MNYTTDAAFVLVISEINEGTISTIQSMLNQTYNGDYKIILVEKNAPNKLEQNRYNFYNSLLTNKRITHINSQKANIDFVNLLNHGIIKSEARIVCLAQSGDIQKPDRLAKQVQYLKLHNNIGVFSSYTKEDNTYQYIYHKVTIPESFTTDNYYFGTLAINTQKFITIDTDFIFEPYWEGSFLQKFILFCAKHNLNLYTTPDLLVEMYKHCDFENKFMNNHHNRILNLKRVQEERDDNLTIVIPFKNEGVEIEKTVISIRATTHKFINILLVNDKSDDGYPYEEIAKMWGCLYTENSVNLGVAGSRDHAIFDLIQTEYFMILDGHMRFFEDNWDDRIIPIILEHPNDILCSSTIEMTKDKDFYYNENGAHHIHGTVGAYLDNLPYWGCKWHNKEMYGMNMINIPCVLGACYMSSKTHWARIGGLKFLLKYGLDEQMMSIKNFMYGGQNLYMMDFFTGHFYKVNEGQNKLAPVGKEIVVNHLIMTYLFNPDNLDNHINKARDENKDNFNEIMEIFKKQTNEIDLYKQKMLTEVKYTFNDYIKFNNDFRYYMNGKTVLIIGCWQGSDIDYFSKQGYKVIAFEANQQLYVELRKKYAKEIKRGIIILRPECVWKKSGKVIPFYIEPNNQNWSSINNDVVHRIIQDEEDIIHTYVNTITIDDIIKEYGMPDLCRISVAGGELEILEGINKKRKPVYLTTETEFLGSKPLRKNEEYAILDKLASLGYDKFHLYDNHNYYKFGELIDTTKSQWLPYEGMRDVITIHRKQYFMKHPDMPHYCYYTGLHCSV